MDKLVFLGKNFRSHIQEMKQDIAPKRPVIFIKPPSVIAKGSTIQIPKERGAVVGECEMVVKIVSQKIVAWTLGLDLTLREAQSVHKKNGWPWTICKVFPNSAVLGPWVESQPKAPMQLFVNGVKQQEAWVDEMLVKPSEAIAYVAEFFPWEDGDVLFLGTPEGSPILDTGMELQLRWGQCTYTVMIS